MSEKEQQKGKGRPKIEDMKVIHVVIGDEPVDPETITQDQYQRALRVAKKRNRNVWEVVKDLYFPEH